VKGVQLKLITIQLLAKFSANARTHASILSLYDNMRLKSPKFEGKETTWAVDANQKV
jgi:molybdopterin-containing oxidoreductase family iron-sulfur binding subunit